MNPESGPATEPELEERRFSLLDGMFLIAAFAVSLMVHRTFRGTIDERFYRSYDVSQYVLIHLGSWFLLLTLALAGSVVFVAKPGGQARFRQPGALAVLMVTLTWAYNGAQMVVQEPILRRMRGTGFDHPIFWWIFGPIVELPPRAGLAILSCWITLRLCGVHRPTRNWLDRSGRVVGWIWIFWAIFAYAFEFLKLWIYTNNPILKF